MQKNLPLRARSKGPYSGLQTCAEQASPKETLRDGDDSNHHPVCRGPSERQHHNGADERAGLQTTSDHLTPDMTSIMSRVTDVILSSLIVRCLISVVTCKLL